MDSVGELDRLARSFARHLKAENKSPKTVVTYGEAVGQMMSYLASAGATGVSQVSTEHVEGFMVTLLERRSPATANNRFRALRQFFKWLVQEEYIPSDPKADSVGLSLELDTTWTSNRIGNKLRLSLTELIRESGKSLDTETAAGW